LGVLGGRLVGVSRFLGWAVIVGWIWVGEGRKVDVLEGGTVGVRVGVKKGVGDDGLVDVAVRLVVAAWVAVVNSVANASIVSALSVLIVAVADPPAFGIIRSGS
jgi:hypothetical protein